MFNSNLKKKKHCGAPLKKVRSACEISRQQILLGKLAKISIAIEINNTRCCLQYSTRESSDDLKSNKENIDDII